jgi:hypothetical protein
MSLVLGLSFYPLEQAPNMVIYAMSKSGQQRAVSSKLRVCSTQAPLKTRAVAAKKFICGLAGLNFRWLLSFFSKGELSLLIGRSA